MDALFLMTGFFAVVVGIVMLAISAIRKKKLVTWGIVAGGGLAFFFVGAALSSPTTTPSPRQSSVASMSAEEYKASRRGDLAFKELDKNPDKYKGVGVTYTGKIVQIMERGQTSSIRMNITKGEFSWDDTIYVTYDGTTEAVQDDIIQVWGEVQGSYTYESIAGWKIALPLVKAKYVELVGTEGS